MAKDYLGMKGISLLVKNVQRELVNVLRPDDLQEITEEELRHMMKLQGLNVPGASAGVTLDDVNYIVNMAIQDAKDLRVDTLVANADTPGSVRNTVNLAINALNLPSMYDAKGAAAAVQSNVNALQASVNVIRDQIGDVPEDKTIVQMINESKDTRVDTLIGDDTNKSVRQIAHEELATQLIPANASESMDTLQELAAWMHAHPNDVQTMNQAINALKTLVGTIPDGSTSTNVVGWVKEYVDAQIQAAIGDALEESY